jgi:hypothetical protein
MCSTSFLCFVYFEEKTTMMKKFYIKFYLVLFLLLPLLVQAQTFRLDTIPVSPDDPRNINRHRQQPQRQTVDVDLQPISDNRAADTSLQSVAAVADNNQTQPSRTENLPSFDFDRSKLRFGANLGLSVSRNHTTLAFGPQIGYQFTEHFMVGTGIKYHHIRTRLPYLYTARSNLLGINAFGYFYPMRFAVIFVQPEINHIWRSVTYAADNERVRSSGTVPVFLVGAGVRLGRSSHITLNYDLVRHRHSPYPDTVFLGVSAFF